MQITPISFSGKIIPLPRITRLPQPKSEGDIFIREITDGKEKPKPRSLSDFNNEIDELLKGVRRKRLDPDKTAEKFIKILKSKELLSAYEGDMRVLEAAKEGDEPDIRALEDFYTLTFNLQRSLEDNVTQTNSSALVTVALTPFDRRYEDFCVKCTEVFGDDEDAEDVKTLDLSALVEIDDKDVPEETAREVIKNVTEFLSDEFKKDPEPEFDVTIKIDKDYDEKKWLNACTNLFKLITMEREKSQKCDKQYKN